MNWVDYAILFVLIVGALYGFLKGLVVSIFNIVRMIASIIIAKTYYRELAAFLAQNTKLKDIIMKFLLEKKALTAFIDNTLKTDSSHFLSSNIWNDLYAFITIAIINAIAFILIYIVSRVAISLLEYFLKGLVRMPVIKELNRLGGAFIGFFEGVIILMLAFSFLMPISAVGKWEVLRKGIEASQFAEYFYTYNFILGWIFDAAVSLFNN